MEEFLNRNKDSTPITKNGELQSKMMYFYLQNGIFSLSLIKTTGLLRNNTWLLSLLLCLIDNQRITLTLRGIVSL